MQRKGEFLCVVGGLVLLSFPIKHQFWRARENARKSSCQQNLKVMALSFIQYTQDFDGRFPIVAVTDSSKGAGVPPYGWYDAIQPYIRGVQVGQCPSEDNEGLGATEPTSANGYVDYWLNSNVAGISRKRLARPSFTILTGDGGDGTENTNARFNRNFLPPNYAPARRHLGGANYSFADGHVKWLLPQNVTTAPVAAGGCTFSVK